MDTDRELLPKEMRVLSGIHISSNLSNCAGKGMKVHETAAMKATDFRNASRSILSIDRMKRLLRSPIIIGFRTLPTGRIGVVSICRVVSLCVITNLTSSTSKCIFVLTFSDEKKKDTVQDKGGWNSK